MADTYSSPVGETWKYDPEYHRTAEFLGVDKYDREDYDTANKISILRDWGGLQGKEDNLEEALGSINKLRREMGTNVQGKTLVNELYQQIRLKMDTRLAKKHEKKKEEVVLENATPKIQNHKPSEKTIDRIIKEAMTDTKLIRGTVQSIVQQKVTDKVEQALKKVIK